MRFNTLARIGALLAFCVVTGGCVWYGPRRPFDSAGIVKKRVTLAKDNFRVAKSHVEGEAWCGHIFFVQYPEALQSGLGFPSATGIPLGNPDLIERAMADLHSKYDIKGKAQTLHNIVEEWSYSNYAGLYGEVGVKITAEVVEFLDTESAESRK